MALSPQKRSDILDALRRGTVPHKGLGELAVGLDHFRSTIDEQLDKVAGGASEFKAIRGDYGCGKTFFSRWIQERAKARNFAVSEVQISETETPLHKLETVYRRLIERLSIPSADRGAFREIVDGWFFALEEELIESKGFDASDEKAVAEQTLQLMETRLHEVSKHNTQFASVLRAYRNTLQTGDLAVSDGLIAWLGGQPNVAAGVKRAANVKGDVDHFAALSFLQGLLRVLKDSSYAGLVLVLDEVETLQRMRSDVREKALNALRQFIDEIDSGRYPGLFLIITGTPAFFEGPQGIKRLQPLAQRLHTDFDTESRFDNPRAPQIRLEPLKKEGLMDVGVRVRDIFASGSIHAGRINEKVSNATIENLVDGVCGTLGGQVGLAPRIFLKKLIGELLDRVELHDDFDPLLHYKPVIEGSELSDDERSAAGVDSLDAIKLDW